MRLSLNSWQRPFRKGGLTTFGGRSLKRLMYRYGWATRCRIETAAEKLRPLLAALAAKDENALLDVGCGERGVALLLPQYKVTGLDIVAPTKPLPNVRFIQTSSTRLPFADRSFLLVSSIDMLEYLRVDARAEALWEMVRVAEKALVVLCPCGEIARSCDEEFREKIRAKGIIEPDWLQQHLAQPHPAEAELREIIIQAASADGRKVEIETEYCEPEGICRTVRGAAAVSKYIYVLVSLIVGLAYPFFARPDAQHGYRMIITARFI